MNLVRICMISGYHRVDCIARILSNGITRMSAASESSSEDEDEKRRRAEISQCIMGSEAIKDASEKAQCRREPVHKQKLEIMLRRSFTCMIGSGVWDAAPMPPLPKSFLRVFASSGEALAHSPAFISGSADQLVSSSSLKELYERPWLLPEPSPVNFT